MSGPSNSFVRSQALLSPALSQSSDTTVDDLPFTTENRFSLSQIRTAEFWAPKDKTPSFELTGRSYPWTPASSQPSLPEISSAGPSSSAAFSRQFSDEGPRERSEPKQLPTPASDVVDLPGPSRSSSFSSNNPLDDFATIALSTRVEAPTKMPLVRTPSPLDALAIIAGFPHHAMELAAIARHPRVDRKAAPHPKTVRKVTLKTNGGTQPAARGQKRKLVVDEEPPAPSVRPSKKARKVTKSIRGRASKAAINEAPAAATISDAATPITSKVTKPRARHVNPRPTERMKTRSAVKEETPST